MPFTGIIGTPDSELGHIILGSLPSEGGGVGYSVEVLDSRTIRVFFSKPMTDSVLDAAAYVLDGIGSAFFVPQVMSVAFDGPDAAAVSVQFNQSLTYGAQYTLTVLGGTASTGGTTTSSTAFNFVATVPDPPRLLGVFQSGLGTFDALFDRPVAQYNPDASALVVEDLSGDDGFADLIQYDPGSQNPNNLRFRMVGLTAGTSFTVKIGRVSDSSMNVAKSVSGRLQYLSRGTPPYSLTDFNRLQIVDAFVDRISLGELNQGYLNVYFNAPVFVPDATDVARWSVSQSGSHPVYDSVNQIIASNPTDLASLTTSISTLQSYYNSHLAYPGVHVSPDTGLPSPSTVITLSNALLSAYVGHLHATGVHSGSVLDPAVSSVRKARTLAEAISLLNLMKSSYELHRGNDNHASTDGFYPITQPDAVDLRSAALLTDDLRIKFQMHFESPYFHAQADLASSPDFEYSMSVASYPTPTNLFECAGAINELQVKYLEHLSDDAVHLYEDMTNVFTLSRVAVSGNDFVTENVAPSVAAAVTLKDAFNRHLGTTYPTELRKVRCYATAEQSDVSDPYALLCVLEIKANSFVPVYNVTCQVRSSDLSSLASGADFTGRVSCTPLTSAPRALHTQSLPDGRFSVRFDREVKVATSDSYKVDSGTGSVRTISSVRPFATVHTMNQLMNDVILSYQRHTSGPGHREPDDDNVATDSDFPQGDLQDLIQCLNNFKAKLNQHVSSGSYHQQSSAYPVTEPDAIDAESAYALSLSIRDALLVHNADSRLHTSLIPETFVAKGSDQIIFDLDDVTDGSEYRVSFTAQDRILSLAGTASSHTQSFSLPFIGMSTRPVLASAGPRIGLRIRPDGKPSLGSDLLLLNFSRRMGMKSVLPSEISIPGLSVSAPSWISDRTLAAVVSGMSANQYSLTVSSFYDRVGNLVDPDPGPSPHALPTGTLISISDSNTSGVIPSTQSSYGPEGSHAKLYRFINPSRQWLSVYGHPTGFDAVYRLLDSSNNVVGSMIVQDGIATHFNVISLPPGDYGIEVSTRGEFGLGSSFTVRAYHDGTPNVPINSSLNNSPIGEGPDTASFSIPGSYASFAHFTGSGSPVSVSINASADVIVKVFVGAVGSVVLAAGSGTAVGLNFNTVLGVQYVVETSVSSPGETVVYSISVSG